MVMKKLFFMLTFFASSQLLAQDAVLISEGNFVRGVIQGTNFQVVAIQLDDDKMAQYTADKIESFIWNGETYVSKPILINKKPEMRFFKLIESGKVNLYTYGEKPKMQQQVVQRAKVRPSFGVGMGSGGFGGGMGGGISIGGGGGARRTNEQPINGNVNGKVAYFLERPGTGPMSEISLDEARVNAVKSLLLLKLNNDEDLAGRIKATENFNDKNLPALIRAYNEMHK